jgi:hypothetical protein
MDVTEIISLPAAFVRQLARFERVSPFTSSMGPLLPLVLRWRSEG